jgi:hypothetical protein
VEKEVSCRISSEKFQLNQGGSEMEYIPPISLLLVFVVVFVALLRKFTGEQLVNMFAGKNFLLFAAIILFCVLTVVHLFQAQSWTADVLKVIVGIFVGVSAAYSGDSGKEGKKRDNGHGVDIDSSRFGDHAKIAGRDINEIIENMQGDIAQIRDSVVNQYSAIETTLADLAPQEKQVLDYLVNTVYERGSDKMTAAMQEVINAWQSEGWEFTSFSSDYQGIDGALLLFTRPSRGEKSRIFYYHGSQMEKI